MDLAYYRRRLVEERMAEQTAIHPAVRATHRALARGYDERILMLEERRGMPELHLVSAA